MPSTSDIDERLTALAKMTTGQLKAEYQRLFGEPPRSRHKQQLIRRIAWRLQVQAEGDISNAAGKRAGQLADLSWLRLTAPAQWEPRPDPRKPRPRDQRLPAPGTILKRTYTVALLRATQILERRRSGAFPDREPSPSRGR